MLQLVLYPLSSTVIHVITSRIRVIRSWQATTRIHTAAALSLGRDIRVVRIRHRQVVHRLCARMG